MVGRLGSPSFSSVSNVAKCFWTYASCGAQQNTQQGEERTPHTRALERRAGSRGGRRARV
eukprot:1175424-Prorocentrum_minimum.AAC.1